MNMAVWRAFIRFDSGTLAFSSPVRDAAVARTRAAAMAAEAPCAVSASRGGAVGGFARTRMRGGMDGFSVVIAIGLVVIEIGLVRGGVGVGERGGAIERESGGEEECEEIRGGAAMKTCCHCFCFGREERERLSWSFWIAEGVPDDRSGGDAFGALRNRAPPDSSRVFYLPTRAGARPFSRPPLRAGFPAGCHVQAGSSEPLHCC
jgi:hypothetical protein